MGERTGDVVISVKRLERRGTNSPADSRDRYAVLASVAALKLVAPRNFSALNFPAGTTSCSSPT
jgi:hypothetical protein